MRGTTAMFKLTCVLLICVVAVAAGCGSKKKAAAQTPASQSTATPAPTPASTPTTATTSNAGSGGLSGDCGHLASIGSKFGQALTAANASAKGDPAAQARNTAKLIDQLAGAVPSEIQPDLKVFAKALTAYASALGNVHFTAGKTPTPAEIAAITKATQAFASADVQAASAHLTAWGKTHCPNLTGFGTTG